MYQSLHLLLNLSIQGKGQLICMLHKPLIYDVMKNEKKAIKQYALTRKKTVIK